MDLETLKKKITELEAELETVRKNSADPKEVETLKAKIVSLESDLDKAKKKSAMSDDEKEFMDSMDEEDGEKAKKFLAMSKSERADLMKKAGEGDETVVVDGETISKRKVGDSQFKLYKRMADQESRIAKAEDEAAMAGFQKRADDELSNLPGESIAKAKMLKAIAGMGEEDRKTLDAILKAADATAAAGFTRQGAGGKDLTKAQGDALSKWNSVVSEIAKRDSLPRTKAMQKAQAEHPEEFKAYQAIQN